MLRKIRSVLGGYLHRAKAARELQSVLHTNRDEASLRPWRRSLAHPTEYYLDCVRVFYGPEFSQLARHHRAWFSAEGRGFGEDAFHVMWRMLFCELRPTRFLEIGVYRGQTLSFARLLQRELGIEGSVTGISPFTPSGDSVSHYREDVDYFADTLANFARFGLPEPELVRAFSTDPAARERVSADVWDAIYIDGNHDYEIARSDWDLCAVHLRPGGVIVLDDSALDTEYQPPAFATAGHLGPSLLARAVVDSTGFREILRVGHNRVFQKIA